MNQICQTFGHDQRKIQYICLQPQEILWACSQCFEENKDRYDFQPIKNVLEILEQTIKEVRKNNSRKQIDEIKNLFTEVQNQIVEKFNQSMQFLKESFQLQYDELLGFLKFFNTFEIDQLDSDHQENLKYLQIVVHQKASQQTIFEVQTNFKIERLNNIKKKIIENMKELYDQEFELYLERLNIRYNLPNEFREQIKKLQIPEEYLMNDNLKIQYCFNLKKDNNICYNGQLYNDQLQGIGLLEVEDRKIIYYGAFIDGHFTNGIKCKIEENQLFLGSFQYISEYEYQIAHNGTLIQANRMRYDGNFENEIQNGQGICHYKNKDYYCGGWKNGLYEGKGQLNSEDYGQQIQYDKQN
ncbi:unnamed protein product [Paramecium sonneborni]|uniref:MORN repeat protein n=1 Tax=Paramecium sonneborni TaxID=65129 RepID=A0A8S1RDP3_9CILI|nr:unnamed protein product [Paramecium sonneborni]